MHLDGFLWFLLHLVCTSSQLTSTVTTNTATTTPPPIPDNTPALTQVTFAATVGVLLDEIPTSQQNAFIAFLQGKNDAWWQARAELQIGLTGYRLTYREYYYNTLKYQLVLPPSNQWMFQWNSAPAVMNNPAGHRLLVRQYTMTTFILSTQASITISEPALGVIGGQWLEAFVLPIDPTLLFQRTGYACVDEGQYPPGVADPERMGYVFDDTCGVEHSVSIGDLGCNQCHCTLPLPTDSCKHAIQKDVGGQNININYTRIAYDSTLAALLRTPSSNENGADLTPPVTDMQGTRVLYRYFPNGSCERAIDEQCIGGYGWRRLLYFDATDQNVGLVDVDMETTAFVDDGVSHVPPTKEIAHGLYEYSTCHQHYHFRHYGNFAFVSSQANQPSLNSKRGFCSASVNRFANAEWSPTWSNFSTCQTQGITSGWEDVYQQGISCQWIDITALDPSINLGTLTTTTNPDGLLCEGILQKDSNGTQIYQLTNFTTLAGNPVSKQACNLLPGYAANNAVNGSILLPPVGSSYVTEACIETGQHFGPLRNCEFAPVTPLLRTCSPGQQTTLTCTFNSPDTYQVLRVCEGSVALNTGTACREQDAAATILIQSGTPVSFQCPTARDSIEVGGLYSLYNAQLWGNNPASVTCS